VTAPGQAPQTGTTDASNVSALGDYRSGIQLSDPTTKKLYQLAQLEVGGDPQRTQAFLESVYNRAQARGWSIDRVIGQRAYYPDSLRKADRGLGLNYDPKIMQTAHDAVRGGSNLIGYGTGNASGSVGFGPHGIHTRTVGNDRYAEKFGVEEADLGWYRRMQKQQTAQQARGGSVDRAVEIAQKA
jgi:hypothetical protein